MEPIAPLQEVIRPGHVPRTLLTLAVALLFAGIYLFGGRASQRLGERWLRRFHSFAAGLAVSYVFVHIMPALHAIRETHLHSQTDYLRRLFPEYSVYLAALLGFLLFYGLESLVARPRPGSGTRGTHAGGAAAWPAWIHIGGFAWYTWLIAFMMGRTDKSPVGLGVFAVAMGLHLAPIADRLRSEYTGVYEHRGAIVLGLASLAGWACGLTLDLPGLLVMDMGAIVAGGVIVNTAIAELPKEREASYWSFVTGAVIYAGLLLFLSRFEGH